MRISLTLAAVAALAFAAPAHAADLVANGSFELGAFTDTSGGGGGMTVPLGSTVISSWTTTAAELAWLRQPNVYNGATATDGIYHLDLTGYHDSSPFGGVTQTLSTVAGKKYTLSFDIGVNTSYGSSVAITANVGGATSAFNFDAPQSGQSWSKRVMTFTATGASTALTLSGTTGSQYIGLDNVSVNELVGVQTLSQSLGLNAGASGKQKVGTFAGGEQIRLQFGGNGDLVDSRYQVKADGSLFAPATGGYTFANNGQAYPTINGGDGINHFVGGGANYDATGSGYGFAGKLTTNTLDPLAIRNGAIVGTFKANPTANSSDWFYVGLDSTITAPVGGGDLYLAVSDTNSNDNHGIFTGTMSVSAAVPESGAGLLLALGAGVAGVALRKRKAA